MQSWMPAASRTARSRAGSRRSSPNDRLASGRTSDVRRMGGQQPMPVGDLAIIAAIAYQAWSGLRVGLVMGLFQLVVMAAGILGAPVFEEPVAQMLDGLVPRDPDPRRFAVVCAVTTGADVVLGLIRGKTLAPRRARQHRP